MLILDKLKNKWNDTIAMAHVSINGAIQNANHNTYYSGPFSVKQFDGLKRTFSGHFHHHQIIYQSNEHKINNNVFINFIY